MKRSFIQLHCPWIPLRRQVTAVQALANLPKVKDRIEVLQSVNQQWKKSNSHFCCFVSLETFKAFLSFWKQNIFYLGDVCESKVRDFTFMRNLGCARISAEDEEGRVIPPKLDKAFLPLRVPLVDWSRQLEKEEHSDELEVDILSDILSNWVAQKYGQDSGTQQQALAVAVSIVASPCVNAIVYSLNLEVKLDARMMELRYANAIDDAPARCGFSHMGLSMNVKLGEVLNRRIN